MLSKNKRRLRNLLSQNLRRLRTAKGLSQEALGEIAGLHRTYVSSVERGERNISIDSIEKIAIALGVDARLLLEEQK
jgi:transcriptional regulator with XRE-family HTH domain